SGVRWFPYLPFARALPRARAIVHHGGMSTLARALTAGIPQLVLPHGADRPDTARRLAALRAAEYLLPPAWSAGNAAPALARLLRSPEVRDRCAALRARVAESRPLDLIGGMVERAARPPAADEVPVIDRPIGRVEAGHGA